MFEKRTVVKMAIEQYMFDYLEDNEQDIIDLFGEIELENIKRIMN